jgi:hypothetical protein
MKRHHSPLLIVFINQQPIYFTSLVMLAAEHRYLCLIIFFVMIDKGQAAIFYNALAGNSMLPIVIFVEGALHIRLSK